MFKDTYQKEVVPKLKKEIGKGNIHGVPIVTKIVVNIGVGRDKDNQGELEKVREELALILGQTPAFRSAKRAVASFSIRQGDIVGLTATLRGRKMWDFLEKLVKIVLPRTRDFKGISRQSLDGKGNLTIGIVEHTAFPEIDPHDVEKLRGLEVTIVTNARSDEEAYRVLKELGMPFRD
ncbi:MAG: 50S ribosomal protein L5 [Patescibacteria group bacterium]|nr:MAG: 50S ribosomal protein L5 [Patescibacteria group bacterium]